MVFFANSGAGTPLEPRTQKAAAASLSAASSMYYLFERLEDRKGKWRSVTQQTRQRASGKFRKAAKMYRVIAEDRRSFEALAFPPPDDAMVDHLTESLRDGPKGFPSTSTAYREVARRLEEAANAIESLEVERESESLRVAVFTAQQAWELASFWARWISASYRRRE